MIMPSDQDYIDTKQIMLGKATMKQEFRPLADWIDQTFGVKPINILYGSTYDGKRPQIEICFEFERERSKFKDKDKLLYDRATQSVIANKFKQVLEEQGIIERPGIFDFFRKPASPKYLTDNVWVIYEAFEPIARIDAMESIPQEKIDELKKTLNNKELWEISRRFSGVTFFLYTDEQVKEYEKSEVRKEWANKFFDVLEPYNEFGYFKRKYFSVYLDSKENFDNNYQSSWDYYYR